MRRFLPHTLALLLAAQSFAAPLDSTTLTKKIQSAASRWSLDPSLVRAIVEVESKSHPRAVSRAGAMGLMQVMPETATDVEIFDPFNPLDNLMGACRYLRLLMNRYQNLTLVLAAYNAGPRNVDRYGGIPPYAETQKYVRSVLSHYDKFRKKK